MYMCVFFFFNIMATRPRLVVSVDDISEGTKDVAFEGKILNQYGNWDSSKVIKHKYLHCDLIDRNDFTTVILNIHKDEIPRHEAKIRVGGFICIENFGVSKKSKKSHEKGDVPFVLKVQSTTIVTIIVGAQDMFKSKFCYNDTITEF